MRYLTLILSCLVLAACSAKSAQDLPPGWGAKGAARLAAQVELVPFGKYTSGHVQSSRMVAETIPGLSAHMDELTIAAQWAPQAGKTMDVQIPVLLVQPDGAQGPMPVVVMTSPCVNMADTQLAQCLQDKTAREFSMRELLRDGFAIAFLSMPENVDTIAFGPVLHSLRSLPGIDTGALVLVGHGDQAKTAILSAGQANGLILVSPKLPSDLETARLLALASPKPVFIAGHGADGLWTELAASAWEEWAVSGPRLDTSINPQAFVDFLTSHFGDGRAEGFDLVEAQISDVEHALANGVTCEQITNQSMRRMTHFEKKTGLGAITVQNAQAHLRAQQLEYKASKGEKGPLFCVPLLVKDNYNTHDMQTTAGSIAMKGFVPPRDAFMVRKIREADAVVVAKTNMAEWAFSPRETVSSSFGVTRNAYDLDRVPAGSSGGTASGVAASYAVAGLGSDTGNSIRGPSSHLDLVGLRATFGLVSRDGVVPLIEDRDVTGPMAKSVRDAAIMFNVMAGYDPKDPYTEAGKGKREADYTKFLNKEGLKGARIGVMREWVDEKGADPRIKALFFKALADMKAQGAIIVDPVHVANMKTHLAEKGMFCPSFRHDVYTYMKAVGPTAPFDDIKVVLDRGEYGPDVKGSLESLVKFPLEKGPEQWDKPCETIFDNKARMDFRADVVAAMNADHLDALVFPTWSNIPAHINKGRAEYKGDNSQVLPPDTGMPAMTVPMGFTDGKWPVGVTFVARPFDEKTLFSLGYSYEQAAPHRKAPPGFGDAD